MDTQQTELKIEYTEIKLEEPVIIEKIVKKLDIITEPMVFNSNNKTLNLENLLNKTETGDETK